MLSKGERVVAARTNREYFNILHAIHERRFSSETLNKIVKIKPELLDSVLSITADGVLFNPESKIFNTTYNTQRVEREIFKPIDLKPMKYVAAGEKRMVIEKETKVVQGSQLDEYGVFRALDRAEISLHPNTLKKLAKIISDENKDEYAIHRK